MPYKCYYYFNLNYFKSLSSVKTANNFKPLPIKIVYFSLHKQPILSSIIPSFLSQDLLWSWQWPRNELCNFILDCFLELSIETSKVALFYSEWTKTSCEVSNIASFYLQIISSYVVRLFFPCHLKIWCIRQLGQRWSPTTDLNVECALVSYNREDSLFICSFIFERKL